VSLAAPLVLLALLAIPGLALWYARQQRRRRAAAAAFASPVLAPSVAPRRPGWRRHAPIVALALALAVLIVAGARPRVTEAQPVKGAAIVLANDISNSMEATDVRPSRLAAAKLAAERFLNGVPSSVRVGQIEFARHPTVLQSPTLDRSLTRAAIESLHPGGGGTAIGDAIELAVHSLTTLPRQNGKRLPGAIVLLSDGGSNVGVSPLAAAAEAKAMHIPIYTIALGTPAGTIPGRRHGQPFTERVPVSTRALAAIASASGGHAYTAADSASASAVYAHLATELGHRKVKREITADLVGGGLALLLIGSAMSLAWFSRLA
jgi:Ca-activated chloride channel homolog